MKIMEQNELTFNDLPQVIAQLRNEVMGMKRLLIKQQEENRKHHVRESRHKPMTVEEAAEYTRIPLGTLYMNSVTGRYQPPSQANVTSSIRTNLTSGWRRTERMPCR